jgi:hypothetical protein
MKLNEIRVDILNIFSNLTIDDLYSNSIENLVAIKIKQLTNLSTKEEIQKFLEKKFPETTPEMVTFNLNSKIQSSEEKINLFVSEIKSKNNLILKYDEEIIKKNNLINEKTKQQSSIILEIKEIEKEVKFISPLAEKAPYANQLKQLEKDKVLKIDKVKSLIADILNINKEVEAIKEKVLNEKLSIEKFENDILLLNKSVFKANEKLKEENTIKKQYYKDEYDSLEFLFKLFLQEQISTKEESILQPTGEKIYQNYSYVDEKKWVKTGKLELSYSSLRDGYFRFITNLVKQNKNVLPEKWRGILLKNLSAAIPKLSGEIIKTNNFGESCYKRKETPLDYVDISTLFALKIALQHNYSITTDDNEIVLGLSGGVLAKIFFKEKGKLISKFQQKDFEIFANCLHVERYKFHTLYHQTGYADSEIKIKTPGSFTFLIENFVVDIVFEPAPILLDNSNLVKFSPNISGKAKLDDEYDDEY